MSLSVHQVSPKPLPLESWNSHIVHVSPGQLSNVFQNEFYCPVFKLYLLVYGDSTDSVGFRFVDTLVLPSGRSICITSFSLLIRPYVLLRRIELWWAAYYNHFHLYHYSTSCVHPNINPCWPGTPIVLKKALTLYLSRPFSLHAHHSATASVAVVFQSTLTAPHDRFSATKYNADSNIVNCGS